MPRAPACMASSSSRRISLDLGRRGRAALVAHDLRPQAAEAHERRHVARRPRRVDGAQVLVERRPRGQLPRRSCRGTRPSGPDPARGHADMPQLPTTTVVTPWRRVLSIQGSVNGARSEWVWTSMNPGASARPAASIVCAPRAVRRRPRRCRRRSRAPGWISTMRPPATPTDPRHPGAPLPSTTSASLMRRSRATAPAYRRAQARARERRPRESRHAAQIRPCSFSTSGANSSPANV